MRKYIYFLTILFSFSISAQEGFWYDVLLEVDGEDTNEFEKTVDNFYSSLDFPDDVALAFSRIQIKGQGFEETHILSFLSPSSESLANFLSTLSGSKWENYVGKVRPYIDNVRRSAGIVTKSYNQEDVDPIGQAWLFKVKSKDAPAFYEEYTKVMEVIDFPGFSGTGQITHGISDGESHFIYATYDDLNSAFTFGPKNDLEAKAFANFFEATAEFAEFSQTFTRVLIKEYN
jgi:hypothetical protein